MNGWFVLVGAAVLMFSSCGINTSMVQSANLNHTEVNLEKANFVVVDHVTGKDSATYILGIGGLINRSTLQNAHADMMQSANLKGKARAVINVTHEVHITNVLAPIFVKKTVFVHGTVIEFVGEENYQSYIQDQNERTLDSPAEKEANGSTQEEGAGERKGNGAIRIDYTIADFEKGDRIRFNYKKMEYVGQVVEVRPGSTNGLVTLYTDMNGREKKAYLKAEDVVEKL